MTRAPGGREGTLVLLAAVVTVVLWASAFIVVRGAGPYFSPGSLALLRMVVGTAGLGLFVLRGGFRRPARRDLPLIAVWGVSWFCLYNLALNAAELMVDAGTAAMVVNLAPLMVVVIAGIALREGFPRGLLIGAPISFLGVVLIGLPTSSHATSITGLLLALAAAVLYAACTLVQKRLLATVESGTLTFLGALAGTIALLPWLPVLVGDLSVAPLGATAAVVYAGVFPTAIAFTTWAYVLQRTSAGRTSATTYAVPAVAILLSWLLLGEVPTMLMLVGGVLCLAGVFVTRAVRR